MKILYHHRTRAEDAQGIHIREMVNAFRELGHQVEVVGMISPEGSETGSIDSTPDSTGIRPLPPILYICQFGTVPGFSGILPPFGGYGLGNLTLPLSQRDGLDPARGRQENPKQATQNSGMALPYRIR